MIGLKQRYKKQTSEIEPLTEDESLSFLEQVKNHMGGKYYPVFLTLLRTGIRIGELQALRWECVDFHHRTMEIKESWRHGRLTRTKTKKARTVDLTPMLTSILREHRTSQKKAALLAEKALSNHVITGDRREVIGRKTILMVLLKCAKMAGIDRHIRIHDLRHTYATIRLMRGHNIGDVSRQLGHRKISMTLDTCTLHAVQLQGRG